MGGWGGVEDKVWAFTGSEWKSVLSLKLAYTLKTVYIVVFSYGEVAVIDLII